MKIAVIYGTERKEKSSTYQIAQRFIALLAKGDSATEFFLPQAMPHFCKGCGQCFTDYTRCPHFASLKPITDAMEEADLLIFTAPVYVYHVPGQVKALLDHFAYRWMPHQPNASMFHKQALVISTAAGAGTKSTCKDLQDSMLFWGVARTHKLRENVQAIEWASVPETIRIKIDAHVKRVAKKILANQNVKPTLQVKGLFYIMRFVQKKFGFNPADVTYWEEQGWLGKVRPWKH